MGWFLVIGSYSTRDKEEHMFLQIEDRCFFPFSSLPFPFLHSFLLLLILPSLYLYSISLTLFYFITLAGLLIHIVATGYPQILGNSPTSQVLGLQDNDATLEKWYCWNVATEVWKFIYKLHISSVWFSVALSFHIP